MAVGAPFPRDAGGAVAARPLPNGTERRSTVWFISLVLLFSWGPALLLASRNSWRLVDILDFPGTPASWILAVSPLAAAAVASLAFPDPAGRGAFLTVRTRWLVAPLLLPALWVSAIVILAEAAGLAGWPHARETAAAAIGSSLGAALWPGLPMALAQEIGWRGFLLPRLLPHGRLQAGLVVGVIWAASSAPVFLWTRPYENVPFVTGIAAHTIHLILLSLLLTWFYTASGRSLWICGLAHTMLWAFAAEMTRPGRLDGMPILVGSRAILGSMFLVVWVWWLYVRGGFRNGFQP